MRAERLQVLIVTGANLSRGAPGGTRTYVIGLTNYLAARGIKVGILSNGSADGVSRSASVLSVSEEYVPSTRAYQRCLRRWVRRHHRLESELLHLQRLDDLVPIRAENLPPVVCTLHGDSARGIGRRRGQLAKLLYSRRESLAIRRCAALVSVDDATTRTYRRRYPEMNHRISTIPVAVDGLFLEPLEIPPDLSNPMFLYVGRLSVEKRVDLIIDAVRSCGLPSVRLEIVGTGPEESRLRRLADGSQVQFLGALPNTSLARLYHAAAGLVLASEYEGLPTVALEAIASGCPVVAPAGCGLDMLLSSSRGVLAQSISTMSDALVSCLDLRRSRPHVTLPSAFTWSVVGEQLLELYRSLVPGAGF